MRLTKDAWKRIGTVVRSRNWKYFNEYLENELLIARNVLETKDDIKELMRAQGKAELLQKMLKLYDTVKIETE